MTGRKNGMPSYAPPYGALKGQEPYGIRRRNLLIAIRKGWPGENEKIKGGDYRGISVVAGKFGGKPITDAGIRENVFGTGGIFFQFFPQSSDKDP